MTVQEEPIGEPVLQSGKSCGFLTIDFREGVSAVEKLALLEAWKTFALVSTSVLALAALWCCPLSWAQADAKYSHD